MLVTYAEPEDLPDDLATLNGVKQLLQAASLVVDRLCRGAVYETDEDGKPTDKNIQEVFKQATVEQARWADETGGGAASASAAPSSIGSLHFDASANASAEAGETPPGVAPNTYWMLRVEGLATSKVRTSRYSDVMTRALEQTPWE